MYNFQEDRSVEPMCYEWDHIQKVLSKIKEKFNYYFEDFIEAEGGYGVLQKEAEEIASNLGIRITKSKKTKDIGRNFKKIIEDAISNFEKDRKKYLDILEEKAFDEYMDDPQNFKSSVLKNDCPIIHSTIYNKSAKELDKYRYEFNIANASELLTVVRNLYDFATDYYSKFYDNNTYDDIVTMNDLSLGDLDTDDYTVYGVIGGGIKSHFLYKLYPSAFPNRSREALWAMWYLTEKQTFGCIMDSEFLMIDTHETITQQNYFYPYQLFSFYAHQIFQLLKQKAIQYNIDLDPEYRYVFVDTYLSFIAKQHEDEHNFLRHQIKDGANANA